MKYWTAKGQGNIGTEKRLLKLANRQREMQENYLIASF